MPEIPAHDRSGGRLSDWTARWLVRVLAALLGLLTLTAAVDLGLWLLAERSWAEVEEIQGILMIWFGLLAAVHALARGAHLSLDLVAARLPGRWRAGVIRLSAGLVATFGILIAVFGTRLARAVTNTLPATGWSASLQYVPAIVAGSLLAAVALEQFVIGGVAEREAG